MQEKAIKNLICEKFAGIENHNVMTSQEMNESVPSVLHTLHDMSSDIFRPWFATCNRLLTSAPERRVYYSPALGEIAVCHRTHISFWRIHHGGRLIKFVARVRVGAEFSACYAGTCLMVRVGFDNEAVTMICRHEYGLQDVHSVRVTQHVKGLRGCHDLLAMDCLGYTIVFQQRSPRQFLLLQKIIFPFSLRQHVHSLCMPFVAFVPGWHSTVCSGWEIVRGAIVLEMYYKWSSKCAFDSCRWRKYCEESPTIHTYFGFNRDTVWVHDCMGALSVCDARKGAVWRPCFMFSCQSDQYAFTRNVSDVKQAWMGACVR
jgi:hypothetical protein